MKKILTLLIIIGVSLTLESCYYDKYQPIVVDPTALDVSFATDIQPVLDVYCVSCHPALVPTVDFTAANSYETMADLIAEGGVVPGDAGGSELIEMLNGTSPDGNTMPPGSIMSAVNIALFESWINQGAKNN